MAKRATLSAVPSYLPGATSASAINASDDALNAAFDNTLSLDGSAPNQMAVDFDMNSNDVLNVGTAFVDEIVVDGIVLTDQVTATSDSAAAALISEVEAAVSAAAALVSENAAGVSAGDRAPIESPTFTGTPAAPTATPGTDTTQLATTAFVEASAGSGAPIESPTFTGDPKAPTPTTGDNDTSIATTAFVKAQTYETVANVALKAPIASPTFTGTAAAPTAAPATSTTQLATTAFATTADDLKAPLISPVLTTPQINDTSADHQYIFGVSELIADRTVTLPLLTGDDTFTFNNFIATFQNKTLDLGVNTLTGTLAEFNTALQSGSFASLAGSEILTNKTIDLDANTLTGTLAEFNTALQSDSFMTTAGGRFLGEIEHDGFLTLFREDVTIVSGVVTATKSSIRVEGESDSADDLDTVNGASAGRFLLIQSRTGANDITVTEAGNLRMESAGSFVLTNVNDRILFIGGGSFWNEISRSDVAS